LWTNTTKGLVVLSGCCHAGFINTCEYVRSLTAQQHIHAVIGGFHLAGVIEERLKATVDYINASGIDYIIPLHCTGDNEINWLTEKLGEKIKKGECGMKIKL